MSVDTKSSISDRTSTETIERIINRLLNKQVRDSTIKNYLCIWRQFNKFLITLDVMPKFWEQRTTLFIGYLINKGMQSSTIKSYVSGIKKLLVEDKYNWEDSMVLLTSLTKACKMQNDHVYIRLPIRCGLLELILFEIQRKFMKDNQWYLECLFKALFALGYYGLLRISELAQSPHVLKAAHVNLALNKEKLLLILYSSKTHDVHSRPHKITRKPVGFMQSCCFVLVGILIVYALFFFYLFCV